MPLNCVPATTTRDALAIKQAAAAGQATIDVAFWGGVVPGNASELAALYEAGVCGFKCFLSPSGVDEFHHVGEADLHEALPILAALDAVLLAHAEWPPLLMPIPDGADVRQHATWSASRPPEAEVAAVDLLMRLAHRYAARVHIVHVAAAEALPLIAHAKAEAVRMTAETCPHYLTFAEEEVPAGGTAFKCAPPIRSSENRERLWKGLDLGTLDAIMTDHSPSPPAMKCLDTGDFTRAWGGIASLQLGLRAVWTGASARGHSLADVARWMCDAPARLAGLGSRKGRLAPGFDADLVFFDPDAEAVVDSSHLLFRHPLTPYEGRTLRGVVRRTLLRGEPIYDDGAIVGPPRGQLLQR
jgi:allantoinase